jgi:hypothetical protein
MFIISTYYNARMYGGGLKEMPCFRTHIKLVPTRAGALAMWFSFFHTNGREASEKVAKD